MEIKPRRIYRTGVLGNRDWDSKYKNTEHQSFRYYTKEDLSQQGRNASRKERREDLTLRFTKLAY